MAKLFAENYFVLVIEHPSMVKDLEKENQTSKFFLKPKKTILMEIKRVKKLLHVVAFSKKLRWPAQTKIFFFENSTLQIRNLFNETVRC